MDSNGNIVNDPFSQEPASPNIFEEGNEAAGYLFPLGNGRQNYHLYKSGEYMDPLSNTVHGVDKTKIDQTMIPPNGG